jgi:large subunit ribosomal protein L1
METTAISKALAQLREKAVKRNFVQTIDLIINLKNLDLKQADQQVDQYILLPKTRGRQIRIGAFIGAEMAAAAKGMVDVIVMHDDFPSYAGDKKKIKKLAQDCDFFISQANIMPDVAKVFGRVLGPRGKMPNPKAGCVVAPNANLKPLADRLRTTVRCAAKTQLSIKLPIGKEDQKDEDIIENVHTIIEHLLHALPQEKNNVGSIILKLTMGAPVKIVEGGESP